MIIDRAIGDILLYSGVLVRKPVSFFEADPQKWYRLDYRYPAI